ncbi:transmembrane amino acid transporter protein-domain-containing protein [Phascolomyces articulosus]|uniref:Transmembrane amino acid transporter protein-domain-containing protein n=1 Tax=Phascolomyces articulosus TaxID=60185 RepID=A0AAD5K9Z5_9FUNG|nr:transmembrane amino acid transporter protein-domain-containing protein [Phascolomyces articulosus]
MQQVYSRENINNNNDVSIYKTISQRTAPATTTTTSYLEPLSRHATVASVISEQLKLPPQQEHKKSTFVQSVFNAMNVLIGVGILAFPLAFRYAGWLIGGTIFCFCAIGTNYTAKILARSLDAAPGASTYGDMGMAAFGERGRAFIGGLFYVELATMGVAMVTLLGDGLQALYPSLDFVTSRILCFCLMTPFEFLSLRKLSVASLFGIISCVLLMVIVLFDGLSKTTQPGSLWDPMETELLPSDPSRIPLSFGLMMAGFAGHAVFPAIYRDMENPKKYDQMVDITYVLTIAVYALMAVSGYLMFGSETMQEITQNLAVTEGYYKIFNSVALWLVVITPIAKFALIMNPLNVACELWIQAKPVIDRWLVSSSETVMQWKQTFFTATVRLSVTTILVYIAVVFPGFDRVMSLLGALFSFGISVIFPLMCYQRLYANSISVLRTCINVFILAIAISMAAVGTTWSFIPHA